VAAAHVLRRDELPTDGGSHELVGANYGDAGASLILVDAPPGHRVALHRHPYAELFVVNAGQATFTAGDDQVVVHAGEIVVVPAGVPHGFVNSGDGPLRQVDIHASPRFVTEWLEGARAQR
jgi:quercetin dioxygenase-like cupin family protein